MVYLCRVGVPWISGVTGVRGYNSNSRLAAQHAVPHKSSSGIFIETEAS